MFSFNNIQALSFLISDSGNYSYQDFKKAVQQYSSSLKLSGVSEGSYCAILSENSPEYIILLFALWNCGAVAVPINLRLNSKEIDWQLSHSKCDFLFIGKQTSLNIESGIRKIYISDLTLNEVKSVDQEFLSFDESKTSLIIFTSGTSGNPKGVIHTLKTLINNAESADTILKQSSDDKWLASLPFYHIGGIGIVIRAVLNKASLIIPPSLHTNEIINSINRGRPTLISLVPTVLKRIIKEKIKPCRELRYILLGGAPSEDTLLRNAIAQGWKIIKVYGSTETASMICAFVVNDNADKISSSGKALRGTDIIIADESMTILKEYECGEICIKGNSVSPGYLNNAAETDLRFKDGLYRSGDYGWIDRDGFLYVQARELDLIISGGENINATEIENLLKQNEYVEDACVFGIPDDEWGYVPVAVITLRSNTNEEELISHLRQNIASYKIPRHIYFAEEFPRTALGKIKKDEVRKKYTG